MRKISLLIILILILSSLVFSQQTRIGGRTNVGGKTNVGNVVSGGGGGDIVNDTFTQGSDVNLSSHTGETGATWTLHPSYSGTITNDSTLDRIYLTSASAAAYYASGVPSTADYCNEVAFRRLTQISTNASVFVGLDTSADTGLHLRLNDTGSAVQWEVMDRVTGSNTILNGGAAVSGTNVPTVGGAAVVGKICRSGTSVTVFFDGVQNTSLNSTTSLTSTGRCGIRISGTASSTTGVHLDNLVCH